MNHFNEAARSWDSPEKIERAAVFARAIKARVPLDPPIRVLDVGCGTGLLAFQFRDQASAIVGIDTSPGMLEVFREKAKEIPGAEAVELNLEERPFEGKGEFDLIVSSLAFHHFEHPAEMLRRLAGMLCPRGRVAIVDLDQEDGTFHHDPQNQGVKHFGFSRERAESWAREAGLSLLSREIVHQLDKNGRKYPVFLGIFGRCQAE